MRTRRSEANAMDRRRAAQQGAAVGLCLGLSHAIAETGLLGWYGVEMRLADVGCFLIAYGSAAAVAGAVLGFLLARLERSDRWCAVILTIAYVAVACTLLEP